MTTLAILPACREEGRVGDVVRRLRAHVPAVLVVDDGSPDGTAREAQRAGARVISHSWNQGKGAALRTGFTWALERGADPILTMDADGQHLPEEVPRVLSCAEETGADIVLGRRSLRAGRMPPLRRWTNRAMSVLLSGIAGCSFRDSQSGFRLYRARVFQGMPLAGEGYDLESEVLVLAARRGLRIREVEVSAVYGREESKIRPVRDTVRFLCLIGRLGI